MFKSYLYLYDITFVIFQLLSQLLLPFYLCQITFMLFLYDIFVLEYLFHRPRLFKLTHLIKQLVIKESPHINILIFQQLLNYFVFRFCFYFPFLILVNFAFQILDLKVSVPQNILIHFSLLLKKHD